MSWEVNLPGKDRVRRYIILYCSTRTWHFISCDQISSSWEEDSFHPWVYNRPEAWTVYIRCFHLFPIHGTFWGWNFYLTIVHILSYFCFSSRAGKTYRCISVKIQVMREEEFAPVKNANGATYDTPDSAKLMLLRLHSRWVVAAGGFLTHSVPLYMTGNLPYWWLSTLVNLETTLTYACIVSLMMLSCFHS